MRARGIDFGIAVGFGFDGRGRRLSPAIIMFLDGEGRRE
jgi:hypothetical protein